jgi:hypothetical protein
MEKRYHPDPRKPVFSVEVSFSLRDGAWSRFWTQSVGKGFNLMRKTSAIDRLTAGFEYIGPPRHAEAQRFGLID